MNSNCQQSHIVMVDLNPVKGSEQSGIRPCIIISGDAFHVSMIMLVVPLTTQIKNYPCNFVLKPSSTNNLSGDSEVLIGHVRAISQKRIIKKIGEITPDELHNIFKGFDMLCDR